MNKPNLQQLLNTEPLELELETMEYVLPELKFTYDEDSRHDFPAMVDDDQEKENFISKFELLHLLLSSSNDIQQIADKVDEVYQAEKDRYEENMQAVFTQTKPFEKIARSLHLLYENAAGDTNVYIMPVNGARFADSANPKHFDEFRHYLRVKFYEWMMNDSPFYISYIGDIGSKSAMDKMAMIAQETRALAVLDIKEMDNAKKVMEYADKIKITGIPAHHAHMVIMGTWVYAHNAFEVEFTQDDLGRLKRKEMPMAVPAAGAFIGKMMSAPPGYYITGLEQSAITGINGVRVTYDLQRIEAKEWEERGLIQIEPYGHIMGTTTANKSNNYDLRKFPKVDVANALLKDLVQYCNNKAFSKWGQRQKREFQREIEIYLNRRIKHELIQGYEVRKIEYDPHEEKVDIDILIHFFEVADEFDIKLSGPKGMIDFKKDDEQNN